MPAVENWTSSDAWFAAAIATIGGTTTLDRIIEAGDAINRAIFIRDEIEQAVRRLQGSGLLEVTPDMRFRLTGEGRSLLGKRKGGLIGQTHSVHELLKTVEIRTTSWTLDDADVNDAYQQYRHRVSAR